MKPRLVPRHSLVRAKPQQRRGTVTGLARALLYTTGKEDAMTTMNTIKMTFQEWGYPAAVLISWMMATAYTLSRIL
jgi:hypothetical protein